MGVVGAGVAAAAHSPAVRALLLANAQPPAWGWTAATAFRGQLMSGDPGVNPDFHDWTRVYVPYCSGDLHSGIMRNRTNPFHHPTSGDGSGGASKSACKRDGGDGAPESVCRRDGGDGRGGAAASGWRPDGCADGGAAPGGADAASDKRLSGALGTGRDCQARYYSQAKRRGRGRDRGRDCASARDLCALFAT